MELIDTGLTLKEREHMRMLLEDGEEVLWMARPLIPWWSSAILPVGIFGLVWCGMLTKMCSCGADWGMLPFVLVGVALLVAPFLIYRYHKHSAYVLTNKYAHILRPGLTGKVSATSYPAGSNMVVKTEANLNDTGSLIFGYNTVSAKHGSNPPAWKKGETASIIYPAGEPEKAASATFGGLWAAGVFLSVFGLIFIAISSITLLVVGKKKAKKS